MASCPFPGMDPWLENPRIWRDLHERLAYTITEVLQPILPGRYYAQLDHREEVGIVEGDVSHSIVPDIVVIQAPGPPGATGRLPGSEAIATPVLVKTLAEPVRHAFVEIRDIQGGGRVVTLIEIVSPSNKAPGPDRAAYLRKQAEILASDTHLVEIDLLRSGDRVAEGAGLRRYLAGEGSRFHYFVFVSRAGDRRTSVPVSRPFTVRDPLPRIALPLSEGDPDVVLDLPAAFEKANETGPYRKAVRYAESPEPRLDPEDAAWAQELLRAAGKIS